MYIIDFIHSQKGIKLKLSDIRQALDIEDLTVSFYVYLPAVPSLCLQHLFMDGRYSLSEFIATIEIGSYDRLKEDGPLTRKKQSRPVLWYLKQVEKR